MNYDPNDNVIIDAINFVSEELAKEGFTQTKKKQKIYDPVKNVALEILYFFM